MPKSQTAPAAPAATMKTVTALDLVRHESARAMHIEYGGSSFNGIRVSKRRKNVVIELELSAVRGVVGSAEAVFVTIRPEDLVQVKA